ncbi:trypsin-like serine peptidase [Risungbinella massiliensis]|uniref:trypsin-like serine peptidase n=1 Tax=Risungbinella massiliensis TaxID=1329796 RepID=UPI0005CC8215|nr:serine protease [Risungbinella massiliensis]
MLKTIFAIPFIVVLFVIFTFARPYLAELFRLWHMNRALKKRIEDQVISQLLQAKNSSSNTKTHDSNTIFINFLSLREDHRRPITTSHTPEAKATCRLTWSVDDGASYKPYQATAFVLSPKVVITNAHCVQALDNVIHHLQIIPSINGRKYPVEQAYIYPRYNIIPSINHDLAVLVLREELPRDIATFALYPDAFYRLGREELPCHVHAYPGDKTEYTMWQEKRNVFLSHHHLYSFSYGFPGQSGAPIALEQHPFPIPTVIGVERGGIKFQGVPFSTMVNLESKHIAFIREAVGEELFADIVVY